MFLSPLERRVVEALGRVPDGDGTTALLRELWAEHRRVRNALAQELHEVEQVAAKALDYPRYPEDWDAGDDRCVGEHTAVTIVSELVSAFKAAGAI